MDYFVLPPSPCLGSAIYYGITSRPIVKGTLVIQDCLDPSCVLIRFKSCDAAKCQCDESRRCDGSLDNRVVVLAHKENPNRCVNLNKFTGYTNYTSSLL